MNQNTSRYSQRAIAKPLPLDMRHFRAPLSFAQRLLAALEPHLYFWTPAIFCALLFCALLLTNYISWRV